MIQYDWLHVFFVAVMGASLTIALRSGTLWPVFPNVRRTAAPVKFWLGIAFYSFFVIGFLAGIVLVLFDR
jgi:hypothetical protein